MSAVLRREVREDVIVGRHRVILFFAIGVVASGGEKIIGRVSRRDGR